MKGVSQGESGRVASLSSPIALFPARPSTRLCKLGNSSGNQEQQEQ